MLQFSCNSNLSHINYCWGIINILKGSRNGYTALTYLRSSLRYRIVKSNEEMKDSDNELFLLQSDQKY